MLLPSLWFSLLFLYIATSSSEIKGAEGAIPIITPPPPPALSPPPPPPNLLMNQQRSPFKPSVAVIVGVVTTIFSITFLVLLYAKHCKTGNFNNNINGPGSATGGGSGSRKNSGIDRIVIESLPIFQFGSLRGQKEGLECAVCLNKFEAAEVLKLLPKCNHAFHVECVDTWLDAHSTCPLCRYRVHHEDILFNQSNNNNNTNTNGSSSVVNNNILLHHQNEAAAEDQVEEIGTVRRVSGRHSSAGERGRRSLQIVVEKPPDQNNNRRSLDSSYSNTVLLKKRMRNNKNQSEDKEFSAGTRKDGLLLTAEEDRSGFERRFGHRIIVSGRDSGGADTDHRWSEVNPSDLLYLRSEMIISDSRRFSGAASSRPSSVSQYQQIRDGEGIDDGEGADVINNGRWQRGRHNRQSGRSVINSRSVSEITGLSRTRVNNNNNNERNKQQRQEQRKAGVVSRWLAWTSDYKSQSRGQHAPSRSGPPPPPPPPPPFSIPL